ncbi:MAG TPA: hypothetical protein DIS78_09480 [Lachnospiraceae bacterium]|nr:hypothetical protein [Lachnospiraceae bacterium]
MSDYTKYKDSRPLTEALQGRNLEGFANSARAGTLEQSKQYHNLTNKDKIGVGTYPAKLFTDWPMWEYRPWTKWENIVACGKNSNREFLRGLLSLLREENCHPLVRSCSFLGFPCVFIVVPGFSEIYMPGQMKAKAIVTTRMVRRSFDHFPELTAAEEKRLMTGCTIRPW